MTQIITIILLNIFLYWKTIFFGYVVDDEEVIESIRNGILNNIPFLEGIKRRFYGAGSLGFNARIDHGLTLFLHTLICILMYFAFGHNHISFIASLLYAVNPANHQTSIWLNGRRYSINIIMVLSMMILSNYGFIGKGLAAILYFSTGLFHMTAIFSAVLFGAYPSLLVTGLLILFKGRIRGEIKNRLRFVLEPDLRIFKYSRLIVIIKSFGFYFSKMLIPGVCAMMYPNLFYWGKTKEGNKDAYAIDRDFYMGGLSIIGTAWCLILIDSHYRIYILFLSLSTLQWCNILPFLQILADRYISLPNVFMMFFLSYFLHFSGIFYVPLVCIIGIYYYLGLTTVMPMYKDINAFYQTHMKFFPHIPWPRTVLITRLFNTGRYHDAELVTKEGLILMPSDYGLLFFGAIFCCINKDYENGMTFLNYAENNIYFGSEEKCGLEIKGLRDQFETLKKELSKIHQRK